MIEFSKNVTPRSQVQHEAAGFLLQLIQDRADITVLKTNTLKTVAGFVVKGTMEMHLTIIKYKNPNELSACKSDSKISHLSDHCINVQPLN